MNDARTLRLQVGRWLIETDEEGELYFQVSPGLQMTDLTVQWGPGPRQWRSYALQEDDLLKLYEWLTAVLGVEVSRAVVADVANREDDEAEIRAADDAQLARIESSACDQ